VTSLFSSLHRHEKQIRAGFFASELKIQIPHPGYDRYVSPEMCVLVHSPGCTLQPLVSAVHFNYDQMLLFICPMSSFILLFIFGLLKELGILNHTCFSRDSGQFYLFRLVYSQFLLLRRRYPYRFAGRFLRH